MDETLLHSEVVGTGGQGPLGALRNSSAANSDSVPPAFTLNGTVKSSRRLFGCMVASAYWCGKNIHKLSTNSVSFGRIDVRKRPYLREFLSQAGKLYELVVFTAAVSIFSRNCINKKTSFLSLAYCYYFQLFWIFLILLGGGVWLTCDRYYRSSRMYQTSTIPTVNDHLQVISFTADSFSCYSQLLEGHMNLTHI